MAAGDYIGGVSKALTERMKRVDNRLKSDQAGLAGMQKRTPEELQMFWDAVMGLPDEERKDLMRKVSKVAGHSDDEQKPCEMCRLVLGRMS